MDLSNRSPSWPGDLCEPGAIGPPAPVSIGNFQPEFAWINIAQPQVRSADLQQGLEVCLNDFFPTLEQRYIDTFPCDSHVVTNPLAGEYQGWSVPFPAIITPTATPATTPTATPPAVPPTPTTAAVTVLVDETVSEPPDLVFTPVAGKQVTISIAGNQTRSRISFTVSDNVTGVVVAQFTDPTSNTSTLLFTPPTGDALKLVADVTVERSDMYTVNVTQAP